jgi:hypothetical protein
MGADLNFLTQNSRILSIGSRLGHSARVGPGQQTEITVEE